MALSEVVARSPNLVLSEKMARSLNSVLSSGMARSGVLVLSGKMARSWIMVLSSMMARSFPSSRGSPFRIITFCAQRARAVLLASPSPCRIDRGGFFLRA